MGVKKDHISEDQAQTTSMQTHDQNPYLNANGEFPAETNNPSSDSLSAPSSMSEIVLFSLYLPLSLSLKHTQTRTHWKPEMKR